MIAERNLLQPQSRAFFTCNSRLSSISGRLCFARILSNDKLDTIYFLDNFNIGASGLWRVSSINCAYSSKKTPLNLNPLSLSFILLSHFDKVSTKTFLSTSWITFSLLLVLWFPLPPFFGNFLHCSLSCILYHPMWKPCRLQMYSTFYRDLAPGILAVVLYFKHDMFSLPACHCSNSSWLGCTVTSHSFLVLPQNWFLHTSIRLRTSIRELCSNIIFLARTYIWINTWDIQSACNVSFPINQDISEFSSNSADQSHKPSSLSQVWRPQHCDNFRTATVGKMLNSSGAQHALCRLPAQIVEELW